MGILFSCPQCEYPLNVKTIQAGRKGICPDCHARFVIPQSSQIEFDQFQDLLRKRKCAQPQTDQSAPTAVQDVSGAPTESREAGQEPEPFEMVPATPAAGRSDDFVATSPARSPTPGSSNIRTVEADPLTESPAAKWYVRPPSGGQFGPAAADLMEKWIDEGRVTGDSYVWREGWIDWRIAADVFAELSSVSALIGSQLQAPVDIPQSVRARTAYLKARRRRTIWGIIGLVFGSIMVIGLIVVLFYVVQRQNQTLDEPTGKPERTTSSTQ